MPRKRKALFTAREMRLLDAGFNPFDGPYLVKQYPPLVTRIKRYRSALRGRQAEPRGDNNALR